MNLFIDQEIFLTEFEVSIINSGLLSSTPAKNHAEYDSWLEKLHIFIFDILLKINRN